MPDHIPGSGPTTCGEATVRLLADYGLDTVFGIPGVHTLEFYRGLASTPIRHVQARNEAGAGFMADGYARASGRPGVAIVITGPGVTNALTPLGQSWADSVPVLLLSSDTASHTKGKGWGLLHEIPDQQAVTAPLTALSATAESPTEVPGLLADAFAIFASARPRPVHIAIPTDVAAAPVDEVWMPVAPPQRPTPSADVVAEAASLLTAAHRPILLVGGGAVDAAGPLTELAERLGAIVVGSAAAKGIVPDSHPLALNGALIRPATQHLLATADVVLAMGTELAETDSFVDRLDLPTSLIRVDIDPAEVDDVRYPATVGIVADAAATVQALLAATAGHERRVDRSAAEAAVAQAKADAVSPIDDTERHHVDLLDALTDLLPSTTHYCGDMCQLVYTGTFAMAVDGPRQWTYPAGFCTLGCGVPNAIGAKLARPDRPVVALAGDGGIMFTVQELITAAELGLAIPVIVWDNGGYKQIRDDMVSSGISPVGVTGRNPDFEMLARSMGCGAVTTDDPRQAAEATAAALTADRPTLIVLPAGC